MLVLFCESRLWRSLISNTLERIMTVSEFDESLNQPRRKMSQLMVLDFKT